MKKFVITKDYFESLASRLAENLVKHNWLLFITEESADLVVYGIDEEGNLRHRQAKIDLK